MIGISLSHLKIFLFAVVQIVQPCCKVNIATEKVKQHVALVNIAYVSHNVIFIALIT